MEKTKLSFTNFFEAVKYINPNGRQNNRGNSGIIVVLRQAETARNGGLAEEAGVEPTEDAERPPTDLKSARATGPDTLPGLI
jgi:hypothetical protein